MDQRPAGDARAAEGRSASGSSICTASTRTSRSTDAEAQRALVDAFGGFTTLAREVGGRVARVARRRREARRRARRRPRRRRPSANSSKRAGASSPRSACPRDEWASSTQAQSRLAHAAALIEAATQGEERADRRRRRARRAARRSSRSGCDALPRTIPRSPRSSTLLEPARIELDEAARALRDYRRRLDVDPAELARVEERLVGDPRRRAQASRAARGAARAAGGDRGAARGARASPPTPRCSRNAPREAEAALSRARRGAVGEARASPRSELAQRASPKRCRRSRWPAGASRSRSSRSRRPRATALEQVEFRVASHPKQPLGPARARRVGRRAVAHRARDPGGDERGRRRCRRSCSTKSTPASAAPSPRPSGELLQALGARRQVLCVTHLPQVAAFADAHFRVDQGRRRRRRASDARAARPAPRASRSSRGCSAAAQITAKTRAHAKELFEQHRRARLRTSGSATRPVPQRSGTRTPFLAVRRAR